MALCYETEQIYTGPRTFRGIPDPVKQYLKHYDKFKYLTFIHDSTKDGKEKRQANFELTKYANPKLAKWLSMIPYDKLKDLEEGKKEIDTKWTKDTEDAKS